MRTISMPFQQIMLFVIILLPLFSIAQPNLNQGVINQIESISKFVVEHPQKAISLGELALHQEQIRNNNQSKIIIYSHISRAYTNLGILKHAKSYIDSAETIITSESINYTSDYTRAKVALLILENKEKEAQNFIEIALRNAKKEENDNLQISLLLLKGEHYRNQKNFDNALLSQQQALKLALRKALTNQIYECKRSIGSTYFQLSQFDTARDWYIQAKNIAIEKSDTIALVTTYRNISLVDRDLGLLDDSKQNLIIALQLANELGNPDLMAEILNLLGSLYVRLGKTDESINYYNQSLAIREEVGLRASVAATLENLSRVQKDMGQFSNATANLLRAIEIRKELNDIRNLGSAYNEMGNLYAQQDELADALKNYLLSLKIRQEANLDIDIARSLTNIGLTYRRLGSHKNALKYFDQALELIPEKSDPLGKAYIYILHGNTLRDLNRTTEALASYRVALELRKQTGNQLTISQALRSIGNAYSELGKFSESHKHLNQALHILKNLNDQKSIADTYNELGNVSLLEENLLQALEYFNYASGLYLKYSDDDKRGLTLRKIGEIQTKLGQYSSAIENLRLALLLSEKSNNSKLKELTLLALHDYYFARGDFKEALSSYNKHITIKDSLSALTQKEVIWQASLDLELDKKAQEIKLIEGEVENLRTEAKIKTIQLEQQMLIRNFIIVILIFVIIIAIGSFWGYFIIRKKNAWLNEINNRLTTSENELRKLVQTKDKLFSIIAHDLRSPFTALVGLTEVLSLKAEKMEPQEVAEYSGIINESSQKLLNLIESLLTWSRSQTGKIKITPQVILIKEIVIDILGILELQAANKRIRIDVDIDPTLSLKTDYDTISTVIRNLTSNAIKYTEIDGVVIIKGYQQNGNTIISITDNGVGISSENINRLFKLEDSFSTKGTSDEAGTGLGLIVCKEFVELNGGKISVNSTLGKGTTFTIALPSQLTNN
jgi:signal transduction histidine kinase/predicted negative regulator of RcsB-dependent stress response